MEKRVSLMYVGKSFFCCFHFCTISRNVTFLFANVNEKYVRSSKALFLQQEPTVQVRTCPDFAIMLLGGIMPGLILNGFLAVILLLTNIVLVVKKISNKE
jgi:hypothetical protein